MKMSCFEKGNYFGASKKLFSSGLLMGETFFLRPPFFFP